MNWDYVSELQSFLRSVCQVADLCRSTIISIDHEPFLPDAPQDLVSLQQWMIDIVGPAHPFLQPAQSHPSPVVRALNTLLVYGEALFLKYREELLAAWDLFVSSEKGDIQWEAAVKAVLVHCHACILRELHDIPDQSLCTLLPIKQSFYQSLSEANLAALIDVYGNKGFVERSLMLDVILAAGQARQELDQFFTLRGFFVTLATKTKPIHSLSRGNFPEVEQLLRNEEIKCLYLSICTTRESKQIARKYDGAVLDFLSNLYMTNLYAVLNIYGVTLTGRCVIVDNEIPMTPEHFNVLSKGYYLVSILHEFAHFLMRASTRNVKEFISTSTPTKANKTEVPCRTETRRLIELNFPIENHGEAGYLLEGKLFGPELGYINAAAAEKLLELASQPKPLAVFRAEFCTANNLPYEVSPRMALEKGHASFGKDTMVFGRCGMPQPWRY